MKAFIYKKYGTPDVLELKELEKPAPKDDEVLVKVYAASVNAYDWHLLTADIFLVRLTTGLFKPKNTGVGADIAGRVEAVGKNVKQFKTGDDVFGDIHTGGFAEYACAKENLFVKKPPGVTFGEAAALPIAALTALQALRDKGRIQSGQKVLINGASGGVGTFAVQFAKYFGAEVTAVCSSRNLDTALSLGADHVIDYAKEDFTKNGKSYDLILAANGYHSILNYKRALSPEGIYVMVGGRQSQMFQALLLGPMISKTAGKQMGFFIANVNQKDLGFIAELVEAGKIKPVIDKRYPFSETAEALRYLGNGHPRGKVIITME